MFRLWQIKNLNMKYDIFISYRREGGLETAKHLFDLLSKDGYHVSFDIDTLRNGDFDNQLLNRIKECKDFILIVDEHAFDRCFDVSFPPSKDWMRCELAYALKYKKNIIPIFLNGMNAFPENLPDDIKDVVKKNGPRYDNYFFDEFYSKLKKRFLHRKNTKMIWIRILILAIMAIACIYFFYPNPDNKYKYRETTEFVNNINKWNSLQSYKDNAGEAGNKYMAWYLTQVDKKNMAQNSEFGEVYLKYIVIKLVVLAYIAWSTKDLQAEQDVDYVNNLIDYSYAAIPDSNKNSLSFNNNDKKDRIKLLEENVDICIGQLQKRNDLTKMQEDYIPLLKMTIVNSFWGDIDN